MTRRATAHGTLAGAEAAVARRIALLGAVTQALSEEIAFDRVLERTLDAVMEVTGVSGGGIFLVDEGATDLRLVIHRGISEALANSFVINPSQTVRRLATDPSATLIVSNYDDIENRRPEVAADGIRGYAAIPLQARGRSLGVLIVCNTSHSDFAAADVDLLVSIGKQIGLAIERARLHDASERSLRRAQAFQEIATAITASLDLPTTLARVLDVARDVFAADRAALYLIDTPGRRMHCAASLGLSSGYLAAVQQYYDTHAWPEVLFNDEHSLFIEDAQTQHLMPELADAVRAEGFRSLLFLPLPNGGNRVGTLVLYHDRVRRYSDHEVRLATTFADQANIAIQHARLFDAERRAREQAALILDATRSVTAKLNMEDVLREAGRWITAALRQVGCGVWLLNEDGTMLAPAFRVSDIADPERDARFRALPPFSIEGLPRAELLMEQREPLVISDSYGMDDRLKAIQRLIPFDAYVAVPLAAGDRVVGVVTVPIADGSTDIPREDIDVAMAIARSTALAVDNARLHEQSQRLAASEERNRLARELHDSVTHALFSMSLISQALPTLIDRDLSRARERIDRLHELSRGALAEMRALIFELRPAALEEHGLVMALERHTAAFQSREGVAVSFRAEDARRLPLPLEETVFRVAQEALNNVAKHAYATRVEVTLIVGATDLSLTVTDDGDGFDPDALPPERRSLGLVGMCERALLVQGALAVSSSPGAGATVTLSIPLVADSATATTR